METLTTHQRIFVKQVFELAEIFNYETRNKYRICDESGRDIAYAAEQQKGILGFLFRQFFGHWRTFDIHFFDLDRRPVFYAHHPFRWFFQRLEVRDHTGRPLGFIERQFAIFNKRFEVRNAQGQHLFSVDSPFWRIWTFPFIRRGQEYARISKKWTGLGYELFTDKDTFLVEFNAAELTHEERALILAATLYIDLLYFERKGSGGVVDVIGNN